MTDLRLKIPEDTAQASDRLKFAYVAQEKLRLLHNEKGADFNKGMATRADFDTWKKDFFDPRQASICAAIRAEREALAQSKDVVIDLEKDFE